MNIVAVVNNDANTLALFDVTDPTNIVAKDTIATGTAPRCCYVVDNYVYVVCFTSNRLDIFDITDPDNIVAKDTQATGTGPAGVFVSGNYAYVVSQTTGALEIYDISDPTAIVAKDTDATGLSGPTNVWVNGNYAYVSSTGNNTFAIFDISDPTAIVPRDTYVGTLNTPRGIIVNSGGTVAYVVCSSGASPDVSGQVLSLDVSDPTNILLLDTLTVEVPPACNQVFLLGNYLYFTSGTVTGAAVANRGSFSVIDVTDPSAMVVKGSDSSGISIARGLYAENGHVFVCSGDNDTLVSFDVSTKTGFVQKDVDATNISGPVDVYNDGSYAYLASNLNDRICVYDISDPLAIVAKDYQTGTPFDNIRSCWASGNYIYSLSFGSTSSNRRLQIVDATDKDNLVNKDYDATGFAASTMADVQVVGNYAYVVNSGSNTVRIYDVTDPAAIVAKDTDSTGLATPVGIAVSGDYAYVCSSGNSTLAIFDISDPTAIVPKDSITTNLNTPWNVVVDGSYAYVVDNVAGLCIFDISDPTDILAVSVATARLSAPRHIAKSGNYVYIVQSARICVYDVSVVATPVYVTSIDSTVAGNINSLSISGNSLATMNATANLLTLFDITGVGGIMIKDEITTNLNNPYWVHGDIAEVPATTTFKPKVMVI